MLAEDILHYFVEERIQQLCSTGKMHKKLYFFEKEQSSVVKTELCCLAKRVCLPPPSQYLFNFIIIFYCIFQLFIVKRNKVRTHCVNKPSEKNVATLLNFFVFETRIKTLQIV